MLGDIFCFLNTLVSFLLSTMNRVFLAVLFEKVNVQQKGSTQEKCTLLCRRIVRKIHHKCVKISQRLHTDSTPLLNNFTDLITVLVLDVERHRSTTLTHDHVATSETSTSVLFDFVLIVSVLVHDVDLRRAAKERYVRFTQIVLGAVITNRNCLLAATRSWDGSVCAGETACLVKTFANSPYLVRMPDVVSSIASQERCHRHLRTHRYRTDDSNRSNISTDTTNPPLHTTPFSLSWYH